MCVVCESEFRGPKNGREQPLSYSPPCIRAYALSVLGQVLTLPSSSILHTDFLSEFKFTCTGSHKVIVR